MRVAAIIVTYNRRPVLAATVDAVLRQTYPPEMVYVIDNASEDDTSAWASETENIEYVRLPRNVGYGAGLAEGLERATTTSPRDAYWLLDDDTKPHPTVLQHLVLAAQSFPDAGMIGLTGGSLTWTGIHHDRRLQSEPKPNPSDFVHVDSSLVRHTAAVECGPPRRDFFMMMEDIEFSWRIRRGGYGVYSLQSMLAERGHLGSTSQPGSSALALGWRRYYQVRNHVRWALDSRSALIRVGCLSRNVKFLAMALIRRDWSLIQLQGRGVRDALANRMGLTLPPPSRSLIES